jgi:hypothetical protein
MTEKLQQTIKEELAKLPQAMQEAISTLDWIKITEEMGRAHQFENEKIEDFQLETLLALVGATDLKSYAVNIENQADIIKEEAEKIAIEAQEEIFKPIYKILIENVKKDIKNKKLNWKQSVNFILSGGNYAVFIENPKREQG